MDEASGSSVQVAQIFANVARDLAEQRDADTVARRVSTVATRVLGCPWAYIVHLTERGTLSFPEPDDATLRQVLQISAEEREGIVSETVTSEETVLIEDMSKEDRFPHYCARVLAETSVRSAVSYLLKVGDTALGALTMYSPEPGYFGDRLVGVGRILADHASVGLSHASKTDRARNLEIALMTNRKIGMAIGVLMARNSITDEEAFSLLRKSSQHSHHKLRDVAEYVSMAGELPPEELTDLPKAMRDDFAS